MSSISVFDIFKIGVGPSSSHTFGPWQASLKFVKKLKESHCFSLVAGIKVNLYGSLAKTGKGHGTDVGIFLGLSGEFPERIEEKKINDCFQEIATTELLCLGGEKNIQWAYHDIIFNKHETLAFHPNGLKFTAYNDSNHILSQETYFSIGGGFVVQEGEEFSENKIKENLPFETAEELLLLCNNRNIPISGVALERELQWKSEKEINEKVIDLWQTMQQSVFNGCHAYGKLPGGLNVSRRAAEISFSLLSCNFGEKEKWIQEIIHQENSFEKIIRWVSCFALAVNEQNAAFARIVTAPTNGAAGVIPSVLMYYICFCRKEERLEDIRKFIFSAAQIGILFKLKATISAAQGGCQAEIGVSSAMAAAALTECMGGTPAQALMAAEIAMEHHLGLTCDPIGGLVQIPCIERNSMGAIKAITACQLALSSDPLQARVSLDQVIKTMWETAIDMSSKYKETAEGGLAVNVPLNLKEC